METVRDQTLTPTTTITSLPRQAEEPRVSGYDDDEIGTLGEIPIVPGRSEGNEGGCGNLDAVFLAF